MARDGSGTYTAPSNSFNPAVEGTAIDEADWNTTLDDIETAFTESVFTAGMGATDNQVVRTDGTSTKKVQGTGITIDDSNNLKPTASDGGALGTSALMWSDLFLASGGVINANNGNATITHSAGLWTFSVPVVLPTYTVAGLPGTATAAGLAYASNGRKNGEGAGVGTGVVVFGDGTAWRAVDTGATVAA
jgi:hypothetical protein